MHFDLLHVIANGVATAAAYRAGSWTLKLLRRIRIDIAIRFDRDDG